MPKRASRPATIADVRRVMDVVLPVLADINRRLDGHIKAQTIRAGGLLGPEASRKHWGVFIGGGESTPERAELRLVERAK